MAGGQDSWCGGRDGGIDGDDGMEVETEGLMETMVCRGILLVADCTYILHLWAGTFERISKAGTTSTPPIRSFACSGSQVPA